MSQTNFKRLFDQDRYFLTSVFDFENSNEVTSAEYFQLEQEFMIENPELACELA